MTTICSGCGKNLVQIETEAYQLCHSCNKFTPTGSTSYLNKSYLSDIQKESILDPQSEKIKLKQGGTMAATKFDKDVVGDEITAFIGKKNLSPNEVVRALRSALKVAKAKKKEANADKE